MDWKQVTVNAITALFIAVLSGVLVWVFTRTPVSKEGLTYSITQAGGFGTGDNRLTFYAINVSNRGSVKAEDVTININQKSSASLFQNQSQYARPIPRDLKSSRRGAGIAVTIPNFLPTDRARYSLVYKGLSSTPEVLIRSNGGVGTRDDSDGKDKTAFSSRLKLFVMFATFAISVIASRFASRFLVTKIDPFRKNDFNNSAFLLMHAGLFDLASDVIHHAIRNGQTGPLVLSNLAAIKSAQGPSEDSHKLIGIAHLWANDKRSRSIVLFNQFIHLYYRDDKKSALETLKMALSTDKVVLGYCKQSLIVLKMIKSDEPLKNLIASFDKPRTAAIAS
ncbi:hypothetical protein [Sphingomonas faeni]|uniref:hypothetical protein n=1 Tax=Sphingomonas faeni TaxID=185950 RepID=UPI0033615C6D